MKNSIKYLCGVMIALLFAGGCKKDTPASTGTPSGITLKMVVTDEDGSPVSGAKVTCGNKSATTSSDGSATLSNVKKPSEKFNIKVIKEGFFPSFKNILYEAGTTGTFYGDIALIATENLGTVSSSHAGNLQGSNFRMTLAGTGFTKENGGAASGNITVLARYISASDLSVIADLMPGGDFAAVDASDQEGILESYGFTATEFRDANGNKVFPKTGNAQMAITLAPAAVTQINSTGGAAIWYFNETTYKWNVGPAITNAASEIMMPVTASTFGNCDKINAKATFKAKFHCNSPDTALVGQEISLTGQNGYAMIYRTRSNNNGNVLIEVGIPQSGGTYKMQINDYTEDVVFTPGQVLDRGEIDVCGLVGQEGSPRFNLQWTADVDVDLYVTTPSGETISYSNESSSDGGVLDVDMMCDPGNKSENVFWSPPGPPGTYTYWVEYFDYCGSSAVPAPFTVIVRNNGTEVIRRTGTVSQVGEVSTKWTFIKQ